MEIRIFIFRDFSEIVQPEENSECAVFIPKNLKFRNIFDQQYKIADCCVRLSAENRQFHMANYRF